MNGILDKRKNSPLRRGEDSLQMTDSEELLLKKKIQIKTQALMMLSQELEQCRMQRDRYKLLAEQLQEDLNRRKQMDSSKKTINGVRTTLNFSSDTKEQDNSRANTLEEDTNLMDMLIEVREQNKCLRLQVDTLRLKLKEAQEDIKALRASRSEEPKLVTVITPAMHQREEMIEQLERLHVKCKQLKLDLQSVLDEKQELIMERDAFKCKAHRLNYELSKALNATKPVDVDSLVNENRYLQERIQQLLEEKELATQSVQKYKSMLDSKRQKGTIKLGGNSSVGSVMTFKQVEQLLQQGPNIPPHKAATALSELHSICTALLEAVNDKNLALAHQKKANKILAARMCELDKAVESPTNRLLEGYSSAEVDTRCDSTSVTSDLSEERSYDKESDLPESKNDDKEFDLRTDESKRSDEISIEQNIEMSDESNLTTNVEPCCSHSADPSCSQSGENSGEQSIEHSAEQSDSSHGKDWPVCKDSLAYKIYKASCSNSDELDKLVSTIDISDDESNSKSFGCNDPSNLKKNIPYLNFDFEESLKQSLPEHLRLLVLKKYNELVEKEDQEF